MSSTNKTTNYELSQYVGSDKPTYLGDYNSDMLKIDTQMKANADGITANTSAISTANTTANTALSTAQGANSTANTANSTANTANSTATQALTKANANESEIARVKAEFDMTNIKTYMQVDMSTNGSFSFSGTPKITVATNSEGTIAKIYGTIRGTATLNDVDIRILTDLRPSSNFEISPAGMLVNNTSDTVIGIYNLQIDTDGILHIKVSGVNSTNLFFCQLPYIIFVKDFGDVS